MGRAEYFDSYSMPPSRDHQRFLRRFRAVTLSRRLLQGFDSEVCGKYAVFFLACRMGGISRGAFYNCFGTSSSMNDRVITEVLQMF